MRRTAGALALLVFGALACSAEDPPPAAPPDAVAIGSAAADWVGRVDISASGNRISHGQGDQLAAPVVVALDSHADWLVPVSPVPGAAWIAVLDDGRLVEIDPSTGEVVVLDEAWGAAEPAIVAGEVVAMGPGLLDHDAAEPLLDGRPVTDGEVTVVLVGPTDRYGHAVLGDDIEASGIEIAAVDGSSRTVVDLERDVVEGRSALLGDADGDGQSEVLVTLSNGDTGARLVVYDQSGAVVAESEPIGRGNRWRNQLAIAPVGPAGEVEVIDIRTPHLGRTIEFFRVDGDRLVQTASQSGFTSHVLGSRNLELAIVADPDGDGRLEVVAVTAELDALGVIARTDDGAEVEHRIELDGRLSSNIGAVDHADGTATYAVATTDGVVRFWPAPAAG